MTERFFELEFLTRPHFGAPYKTLLRLDFATSVISQLAKIKANRHVKLLSLKCIKRTFNPDHYRSV